MNFEDEHYVRIYTRDTKTWLRWKWEGQTVFVLLMRKVDKAGVLDEIEDAVEDVALITGLPVEVVEVGLPRVLESGAMKIVGQKLVVPNYIKAQTAAKSDKLRARESRERRSASAQLAEFEDAAPVTKRDAGVTDRTSRDESGHGAPVRDELDDVTESDASVTNRDASVGSRDETTEPVTARPNQSLNAVQRSPTQDPERAASDEASHELDAPNDVDDPGVPASSPATAATPDAKARSSRKKPGRAIPDDWEPLPRHQAKAAERGVDCALAADKFRAHAGTNDRRCVDWDRAFDGWLLNERGRPAFSGGPPAQFDAFERAERLREAGR